MAVYVGIMVVGVFIALLVPLLLRYDGPTNGSITLTPPPALARRRPACADRARRCRPPADLAVARPLTTSPAARFARYAWGVLAANLGRDPVGRLRARQRLGRRLRRATGRSATARWCRATPALQTLIEFGHRLSSGLALLLIAGLVVGAWRAYPRRSRRAPRRRAVRRSSSLSEALIGAGLVLLELRRRRRPRRARLLGRRPPGQHVPARRRADADGVVGVRRPGAAPARRRGLAAALLGAARRRAAARRQRRGHGARRHAVPGDDAGRGRGADVRRQRAPVRAPAHLPSAAGPRRRRRRHAGGRRRRARHDATGRAALRGPWWRCGRASSCSAWSTSICSRRSAFSSCTCSCPI